MGTRGARSRLWWWHARAWREGKIRSKIKRNKCGKGVGGRKGRNNRERGESSGVKWNRRKGWLMKQREDAVEGWGGRQQKAKRKQDKRRSRGVTEKGKERSEGED